MSWLTGGKTRNTYKRHKTYEHERVQKRLDSVIEVVQSKVEQALSVDSTKVIIFKKAKFGLVCSCNKVENDADDFLEGGLKSVMGESDGEARGNGIDIKPMGNTMFGGKGKGAIALDDMFDVGNAHAVIDAADMLSDGGDTDDRWNAGNVVNCGICYRQGFQPGFQATGYIYNVMTHHHVQKLSGYTKDQSTAPTTFRLERKKGYVDFDTLIPKYFKTAKYSIRVNDRVLEPRNKLFAVINGTETELNLALLSKYKGQHITVRVKNIDAFTHALLIFDLGVDDINGNISEEQNILNYDQELTVGNITVVLPARSGMIEPEDILVLPFKRYVLKVTEAPKKRTAKNQSWEWVVTTRPVQRKELQYNINKGYELR
ncbi:hypothetical protein HOU32_gp202 [Dickeya phage vB_DsoM_JA11]|uniref:Uncharacterized protein n=1 Tax=Dickeya phage vB_DsoM_JA11 TaxID=2382310 RepID=A0A386K731_9CAUD|nr:hypothetical protein HOU32_gp202 [Dickeya phage vB_DsoM_JA11]AYD80007.1 hypothetical protein JA11_202 [Dickeya phage vB_DsoM_JA11]